MNKLYFIYRPATREYLQYIDLDSEEPHTVWSWMPNRALLFTNRYFAQDVAMRITHADKIQTQLITFKEEGRNTIECA